jgi:hypothetical protein
LVKRRADRTPLRRPVWYPREEQLLEQYLQEDVFDVLTVNLHNFESMKCQ